LHGERAWRGLRALRPTRPAGPAFPSAGCPLTVRHRAVAWTLHPGTLRRTHGPADSGLSNRSVRGKVLAGRNPLLLLRFSGSLLLRLSERRFNALLLKAPPRNERLWRRRPAEGMFQEQPLPQSIGIGLAGVTNPAHDSPPDLVRADLVSGVLLLHVAQTTAEPPHVRPSQEPVRGEDPVAQERDPVADRKDDVLPRMQAQA